MHNWVKSKAVHQLSLGRQLMLVREHLGLSLDDMPMLIAQCREQMRECIASMDRQLQAT